MKIYTTRRLSEAYHIADQQMRLMTTDPAKTPYANMDNVSEVPTLPKTQEDEQNFKHMFHKKRMPKELRAKLAKDMPDIEPEEQEPIKTRCHEEIIIEAVRRAVKKFYPQKAKWRTPAWECMYSLYDKLKKYQSKPSHIYFYVNEDLDRNSSRHYACVALYTSSESRSFNKLKKIFEETKGDNPNIYFDVDGNVMVFLIPFYYETGDELNRLNRERKRKYLEYKNRRLDKFNANLSKFLKYVEFSISYVLDAFVKIKPTDEKAKFLEHNDGICQQVGFFVKTIGVDKDDFYEAVKGHKNVMLKDLEHPVKQGKYYYIQGYIYITI